MMHDFTNLKLVDASISKFLKYLEQIL